MNVIYFALAVWLILLAIFIWSCVREGRRVEDEAGQFAEDFADAVIEDIQARRKVKSPEDLPRPS